MMIVAGHLIVDPSQRESCLNECLSVVERWESQADVETFRGSGPSDEQNTAMLSAAVSEYDIANTRTLT